MIETHTCIVITCDSCGDGWGEEEGAWHFDSIGEARRALVTSREPRPDADLDDDDLRWQIEDGKPVMCPHCRSIAICSVEGHTWSDWSAVNGREMFSSRCCYRCSKFESNIDDLVEQMTGVTKETP